MRVADRWQDYQIIDTSGGEKLERWGKVTLIRPDPQIIWNTPKGEEWLKWRDFSVVGMSKQPRRAWSPVILGRRVGAKTAT